MSDPMYVLPASGAFPATHRDWLATQLRAGDDGRRLAASYVMELYAPALAAYFRGSSFRSLGDPKDYVAGFFASRLGRDDFLGKWLASGMSFRRWLINGFHFYVREEMRLERERRGDDEPEPESGDTSTVEVGAVEAFERAWARDVVRSACDRAHAVCESAGKGAHWTLFLRHHADDVPYAQLVDELGVPLARAPGMARTAANVLRRALLEILVRDGVAEEELEAETNRLLSALAR